MKADDGMIESMHARLQRWAAWAARHGLTRGLWYARCRLDGGVSPVAIEAAVELELSDTDRAITRLPDDLGTAIKIFYLGRGTVEQRARDCGCHRITLYARVARAQRRLMLIVVEVAAERKTWSAQSIFAHKST